MSDTKNPSVGDWQGVELLQSGPTGEVWKARSPQGWGLLKLAFSPEQRPNLIRELEVLRRLEHPQIAKLLLAADDGSWIVRSYIQGTDLRSWSRDRSVGDAVEVCAELAEVLAHLHERGVVHADLKPANVVLSATGLPHLIDLGSAFLAGDEATAGAFRGTLGHAAPEQLQGRAPSPSTDFYALACLLYEMLTGRKVFESADPAALAYLPLANLPAPPSLYRLDIEGALDETVLDLLVRDPERRPRDGFAIASSLRRSIYERGTSQLFGMTRARDSLRQLVALASRNQPGAAIVYGPVGSGRKSLVEEAVRCASREGLETLSIDSKDPKLPGDTSLDDPLRVLVGGLESQAVADLARQVLQDRLPFLLLLWCRRPMMELGSLGARHISPEPLEVRHVSQLLERHGQGVRRAAIVHRRARGLPGRVASQLLVPELRAEPLSELESNLLSATTGRDVPLPALASLLGLKEHALVDLAEPLVDRGLLQVAEGGQALRAVEV
ncbi:MAG: serine/threonine-protein kinase [Myxococcota bacterium]|nr:serine/threonine-protein kinase [Myxococcota bacterium]